MLRFNALTGLSCYIMPRKTDTAEAVRFNALTGLSCYDLKHFQMPQSQSFNALTGLSCYLLHQVRRFASDVSMPSRAWVVTGFFVTSFFMVPCFNALTGLSCYVRIGCRIWFDCTCVSMPSRAWVVTISNWVYYRYIHVSMPSRAWVVTEIFADGYLVEGVSMPSRAWVVTCLKDKVVSEDEFQCPHGLELLLPYPLCIRPT